MIAYEKELRQVQEIAFQTIHEYPLDKKRLGCYWRSQMLVRLIESNSLN